MSIKIQEFANAVVNALEDYTDDVQKTIISITDKKTKKLIDLLREKSPKRRGAYAKAWRSKKTSSGRFQYQKTVYNSKKPGLAHLLEDGHETFKGTITKAMPHIDPARDQIEKEFEEEVIAAIENGRIGGG